MSPMMSCHQVKARFFQIEKFLPYTSSGNISASQITIWHKGYLLYSLVQQACWFFIRKVWKMTTTYNQHAHTRNIRDINVICVLLFYLPHKKPFPSLDTSDTAQVQSFLSIISVTQSKQEILWFCALHTCRLSFWKQFLPQNASHRAQLIYNSHTHHIPNQ